MTRIRKTKESIALDLIVKDHFSKFDTVSVYLFLYWINPIRSPFYKELFQKAIEPRAFSIAKKKYDLEKDKYFQDCKRNIEKRQTLYEKDGQYFIREMSDEEILESFRPFRWNMESVELQEIDICILLNKKEMTLVSPEIKSAILKNIKDLNYLIADEYFSRLINEEDTLDNISALVYQSFRENYPTENIPLWTSIKSWSNTKTDSKWLMNHPRYQSWREKILLERKNET